MTFKTAVQKTPDTQTTNGMAAFSTTHSACLDLFANGGAMRGKVIAPMVREAFIENPSLTLQILQWLRDVRGGAGERKLFRDSILTVQSLNEKASQFLIEQAPIVGRWDDVFDNFTELSKENQYFVLTGIKTTLYDASNNSRYLLAKWLPRKGAFANILRSFMKLSPKQYRKLLVNLTNVVESKMCANEWAEIEYGKVPSKASANYQKAFRKHDSEGYTKYVDNLVKGTAKINASAIYPHDVLKAANNSGEWKVAEAQWKNIPLEINGKFLPLSDVSGSMGILVSPKSNITAMDVSIALGMFLAERNEGAFKDLVMTFETQPQMFSLRGSLKDRYYQIKQAPWGGSTNLSAAMNLILDIAVKNKVPQEHMPDALLILSDMQFNSACSDTALEMIEKKFNKAGYQMPQVVFWNLSYAGNNQGTKHDKGVALVSGFSPAIVKSVLSLKNVTPFDVMTEAVSKYPTITVD